MNNLCATAFLLLASTAAAPAFAGTLASPVFTGLFTIDGVSTADTLGTPGTAGVCDIFSDASGCDLDTGAGVVPRLLVDWVDGDSFDIFFFGEIGFGNTASVSFALADLFFEMSGVPVDILDVVLNRADSNLDGFLASVGNPTGAIFSDPVISVLKSGVSAQFNDYSGQLDADGPRFRFDVRTSTPVVAAVPVPAGAVLLASALFGLGALRRRAVR